MLKTKMKVKYQRILTSSIDNTKRMSSLTNSRYKTLSILTPTHQLRLMSGWILKHTSTVHKIRKAVQVTWLIKVQIIRRIKTSWSLQQTSIFALILSKSQLHLIIKFYQVQVITMDSSVVHPNLNRIMIDLMMMILNIRHLYVEVKLKIYYYMEIRTRKW
jgi:hypothetical protein